MVPAPTSERDPGSHSPSLCSSQSEVSAPGEAQPGQGRARIKDRSSEVKKVPVRGGGGWSVLRNLVFRIDS